VTKSSHKKVYSKIAGLNR